MKSQGRITSFLAISHLLPCVVFAGMFMLASTQCGSGAVRVWSGSSSGYWSVGANWGGTAPVSGDDLVFPSGAANLLNTNNLTGLNLRSITFSGSGYIIRGNSITISNGISGQHAAGANTVALPITLGAAQTFDCVNAGASQTFGGSITNAGFTLTFSGVGDIAVGIGTTGTIIVGTGGVTKNGTGTLTYYGDHNSYTGTTTVNRGTLVLNCFAYDYAFLGPLVISDGIGPAEVRLALSAEIPDNVSVTVNAGGTLNLDNYNDVIGSLTLQGGTASSGTGSLTLNGNLTVLASSTTATINGNLRFGGGLRTISVADGSAFYDLSINASISDAGGGLLFTNATPVSNFIRLPGSNSFTGPLTVANVRLSAETPWALGATNGSTTVKTNATLWMYLTGITNEALTLEGGSTWVGQYNCTWAGPVTLLNGNVTINCYNEINEFNLIGKISGAGGFTKTGSGKLTLAGPGNNTYAGDTKLTQGTLQLAATNVIRYGTLTIGDGVGGANADVVRFLANWPIFGGAEGCVVMINASGLLDLNGFEDDVGPIVMDAGSIETGSTGKLRLFQPLATVATTNGLSSVSGKIELIENTTLAVTNTLHVAASISGPAMYALTKTGPGQMAFLTSNSYSGLTVIQQGKLLVNNAWALGSTATGTVVSNGAGLLLQGSFGITNEALTLNGYGPSGWGALDSETSLGTNIWAGPITVNADSDLMVFYNNGMLRIIGQISGLGGLTVWGDGTTTFEGNTANTYAGTTQARAGTLLLGKSASLEAIPGNLVIGDGSGGANADVVRLLSSNQINNDGNVTITNSGLLDMNGHYDRFNALSGSGNIQFGSGGYVIAGHTGASSTYSGVASGNGYIWKVGTGVLTLTGNNTYTGQTRVQEGTLLVNGNQPQSNVRVESGATLGGNGTVGIIIGEGNVAPGTSPGCLSSSNLTFSSTGRFQVELNGQGYCTGHDQLIVRGTNNLANATLQVTTAFPPGQPAIGDQFIILNNDGVDPVTGTFNGMPNGTIFSIGDIGFRINYDGGTGNDVVLTVLNRPGASVTINATDHGWYDNLGFHNPGNKNYLAGEAGPETNIYRNWFVFNVPEFSGTIVQAELLINCYQNSSPHGRETYVLRHVSTPVATLTAGGSGLTNIYNDLGDGPVYSVRNVAVLESNERAIVPLNVAFINDATAAMGAQIALGGSIATLDDTPYNEHLFGISGYTTNDVQLRLTFGTIIITNAIATGWYDNAGSHGADNSNYFAGEASDKVYRNFFVFELPAMPNPPSAAELLVKPYRIFSPIAWVSYELHEVTTPIQTLTNTAYVATNVYADLADGNLLGGRNLYIGESNLATRSSIPLNCLFAAAAFANATGQIALGGALVLDLTPNNEGAFSGSEGSPGDVQLWLGYIHGTVPAASFAPGSPVPLGTNSYRFVLMGTPGTTNEIQASMDFVNWDAVYTLCMTNIITPFNYNNAVCPYRFFRTRVLE